MECNIHVNHMNVTTALLKRGKTFTNLHRKVN